MAERLTGGRRSIDHELVRAIAEIGDIKSQIQSLMIAIFGHPQLREDGGVVGDIHDMATRSSRLEEKLDRIYHAALGLTVSLIGVGVTVALTVH